MAASLTRIRPCTSPADAPEIHRLIHLLAVYEDEPDAMVTSVADFERDLNVSFSAALAEVSTDSGVSFTAVGVALYFNNFSSAAGRGAYLEDIYVEPEARGRGLGVGLIRHCARFVFERGYKGLDWVVLDWNVQSIAFYESLGARILPQLKLMRIDGSALKSLASATARPEKEEAPAVLSRVRDAVPASDAPPVHRLITALSRQRGASEPEYSVESLEKDLGDVCFAVIGEVSEDGGASWRAAGYALFFESYSSWTGKAMYLEDIYVKDGVRGKGVGFKLLKHCAERAVSAAYERIQWTVQHQNSHALHWFESAGASILPEWKLMRIDGATGQAFASKEAMRAKLLAH